MKGKKVWGLQKAKLLRKTKDCTLCVQWGERDPRTELLRVVLFNRHWKWGDA